MDQGSTMKRSAVHNFAPTVTKFCVMWEGLSLPHDTKFGNSRCEIVGRRVIFIWSLIHGLRWSGLIKAEPDLIRMIHCQYIIQMTCHATLNCWSCGIDEQSYHSVSRGWNYLPRPNTDAGLANLCRWDKHSALDIVTGNELFDQWYHGSETRFQ